MSIKEKSIDLIGEALKNIDKRDREFLLNVAPKNYWSKIIKTREILTLHYIDIDLYFLL